MFSLLHNWLICTKWVILYTAQSTVFLFLVYLFQVSSFQKECNGHYWFLQQLPQYHQTLINLNTKVFSYPTWPHLPSRGFIFLLARSTHHFWWSYPVGWGEEHSPHEQEIISFVHIRQFEDCLVVIQTKGDYSVFAFVKITSLDCGWEKKAWNFGLRLFIFWSLGDFYG